MTHVRIVLAYPKRNCACGTLHYISRKRKREGLIWSQGDLSRLVLTKLLVRPGPFQCGMSFRCPNDKGALAFERFVLHPHILRRLRRALPELRKARERQFRASRTLWKRRCALRRVSGVHSDVTTAWKVKEYGQKHPAPFLLTKSESL